MSIKGFFFKQGMKLMQDPRFMKAMQDPRIGKVLMQAFQARGRVQQTFEDQVDRFASSFNLATKRELRELKRTIRKLERDLEEARGEVIASGNGKAATTPN